MGLIPDKPCFSTSLIQNHTAPQALESEALPPDEKKPIHLRPAALSDREDLFRWRNHPDIRRYSIHPDEIAWERHCEWLAQTLNSECRLLLIGESEGQTVGVLRYDFEENTALVSIYLMPEKMGQGYGTPLLVAGSQWLKAHHPTLQAIKAEIAPENTASVKVFERAAYKPLSQPTQQGMLTYEYTL